MPLYSSLSIIIRFANIIQMNYFGKITLFKRIPFFLMRNIYLSGATQRFTEEAFYSSVSYTHLDVYKRQV